MTLAMWLIALWAALVPILALAFGQLELRRDTFFLFVYLQALIYVDIAPILVTSDVNSATVSRYTWVQSWALLLFQVPLVIIYSVVIRRRRRSLPSEREFRLSSVRLGVFVVGSCLFGVAYFIVATEYGLLYRRLGEDLANIQLTMNLAEFAMYRAFIELGPFLMAVQVLLLRTQTNMSRRVRLWVWVGLLLTSLLFMMYALINSRLTAVMTLATLYGIVNVTSSRTSRLNIGTVLGTIVVSLGGLYAMRVVANVRLAFGNDESIFALRNFLPVASREGQADDTLGWRLNGVDLIAMIADNVEAQGPAFGAAWAVPAVLSLDPIVRTPFTVAAKTANLTTAKSWLLLRYSGVGKTDYYSCMLSDVYGNFSIYGFLLPAVLLGIVLARATAALRWSASPAAIVFAAFAMTRVLPFEQEFGSLLFGWYKLVPFVLVALLFYPLRRPRTRTQVATLELQPLTF
jgi:hypothetical protein